MIHDHIIRKRIADLVKLRRKRLGLSQIALANMLDRECKYLSRIETCKFDMSVSEFIQIMTALGIQPSIGFIAILGQRTKDNDTKPV